MKTLKRLVSCLLVFSMIASMFLAVTAATETAESSERTGITVERVQSADVFGEALTHTKGYYMIDKKLEALPVTYEAWVYIPSEVYDTASGVILGTQWDIWNDTWTGGNSGDTHFSFGIRAGGHPTLVYGKNGSKQVWEATGKGVIPADKWTHVVMGHDTREANRHVWCFIDAGGEGGWDTFEKVGKGAGLLELDASALDNPVYLAGDGIGGTSHALDSGIILGDVALYSDLRAASGGEVKYDYENGADLTDPNLILYYQISSANQNKDIKDASGHGYDMNFYRTFLTEAEMNEIRAKDEYEYTYSIAFLPDLQYMTNRFPNKLGAIFDHIIDTKEDKNLQYVVSVGDITDKDAQWEWNAVKKQYDLLDAAGIPYTLVRGNHDIYTTDKVMLDQTFGKDSEYYKHVAANGGFYDTNSATNAYVRFEVGSVKYLILCLDWGIKDTKVLDWADDVIEAHPDRRVMVTMHAWMNSDGTRFEEGDSCIPSDYNSANIDPQQMWDDYFAKHSNIDMIVCGHMHSDNILVENATGTNGNLVYQLLIDSQSSDLGVASGGYNGLGLIAYMYFTEDGNHAKIEYYSTTYNRYYYEKNTEISLDFGDSNKFIESDGTPLVPNSTDNANWTTVDGKLYLKDSVNHSLLRFENELDQNRVEATISTSTAAHKTALTSRGNIRDGIIFAVSEDGKNYYWAFVNAWNCIEVYKMSDWLLMSDPDNNCGGTGGVDVSAVADEFTLAVEWDNAGNIKVYVDGDLIHDLKDPGTPLTGTGYGLRSVKGVASNDTGSYYTSIVAGEKVTSTPVIPGTPESSLPVYDNFKDAAGNVLNPYFVNNVIWDNNSGKVFLPEKIAKGFLLFDNELANNRIEATIVVKDNKGGADNGGDGNKRSGLVFALTDHDGDGMFNPTGTDVSYYWAFINDWGALEVIEMGKYGNWQWLSNPAADINSYGINTDEGVRLAAEWDDQGHIKMYANDQLVLDITDPTPLTGDLYGMYAVKHYNYASDPSLVNTYYTSLVAGEELIWAESEGPSIPDSYENCVDGEANLLNPYFVNENYWFDDNGGLKPAPGAMENFLLFDTPLANNRVEGTLKIAINGDKNTRNGIVFALTDIDNDATFASYSGTDLSYYWVFVSGQNMLGLAEMGAKQNWAWLADEVSLETLGIDAAQGVTLAAEWDAEGNIKVFANGILAIEAKDASPLNGNLYGVFMRSWANTADGGFAHKHTLTSYVAGGALTIPDTTVSVTVDPTDAGTVTGAGDYILNATATLTVTANAGYSFVGWYDGEELKSSDTTYTFKVTADCNLTAKFSKNTYEVTVAPEANGTAEGGGTFAEGASITVTATANTGYKFAGWYNGTTKVSADATYTFIVEENITLTAKFEKVTYTVPKDAEGNPLNPYFVNGNTWTEADGAIKPAPGAMENFILFDNALAVNRVEATFKNLPHNNDGNTRNGIVFALTDIDGDKTFGMGDAGVSYYWACVSGYGEVQLIQMGAGKSWQNYTTGGSVDLSKDVTLAVEWDAEGNIKVFANGELRIEKKLAEPLTGNLYGVLMRSWANTEGGGYSHAHTVTSFIAGGALATPEKVEITVDSTEGGTVTGAGEYEFGASVTLTATPADGYVFEGWYENGELVSSSKVLTFTAQADRQLTAKFAAEVVEFIYGDANGDGEINMDDVILLRKYITKFDYDTNTSGENVEAGADANGDGKINMKDVILLRQYIANYDYETGSSSVVLGPKWQADGELKILAIGNSFSVDAMQYLYQVAQDAGVKNITLGNMYIGGCTLETHLANARNNSNAYRYYTNTNGTWTSVEGVSIETAVTSDDWDFITFQQASGYSGVADTYPDLVELMSIVRSLDQNATFAWHMTWAYDEDSTHQHFAHYNNDQMTMYNAIVNAVNTHILPNDKIDIIIPSGTAVQNTRTSFIDDMTRDGYHLSNIGQYIAAMTYMKALTGLSIDNSTNRPSDMDSYELMAAIESVNNAIKTPFAVTDSLYPVAPYDDSANVGVIPEGYVQLTASQMGLTAASYYNTAGSDIWENTSSAFARGFMATKKFTKEELPVGSIIEIAEGWRYRPEGWEYTGTRPDNVSMVRIIIDEEWWGTYTERAFNISQNDHSTSNTVEITLSTEEVANTIFKIIVPESAAQ